MTGLLDYLRENCCVEEVSLVPLAAVTRKRKTK
jgi:hypothetical protein